jgi:DNA polymerase III delta prime subunit
MDLTSKSFLVISPETAALENYRKDIARHFNVADVFCLDKAEGANSIQVKETAEFITRAHLAPIGDKKLLVIKNVSIMTVQAQNKILKTLEDLPASTTFLLLGTGEETIINTIKSRCIIKYLPHSKAAPIVADEIKKTMKDIFGVEIDDKTFTPKQKYDILNVSSAVVTRTQANCNEKMQQDLIIMELLKNAKNG